MNYQEIAEMIESILKSLAIIVGGSWVYFKFIRTRENHPKIQFDIDLRLLGRQEEKILVEIVGVIVNKGSVRHWLNDFICDVLILKKGDKVETGGKFINHQIAFSKHNPLKMDEKDVQEKFDDRIVWIPDDWYESFIDPGVEQKYTYLTSVPNDTTFVSIFSRFITKNQDFHTAQKTYSIEELGRKNNNDQS
ncbi:MAG: hypothetical protein H7246_05840 [Phycisphaerae bacterium]|nr:hypothetical protein [Saprospiraceae bacterium]